MRKVDTKHLPKLLVNHLFFDDYRRHHIPIINETLLLLLPTYCVTYTFKITLETSLDCIPFSCTRCLAATNYVVLKPFHILLLYLWRSKLFVYYSIRQKGLTLWSLLCHKNKYIWCCFMTYTGSSVTVYKAIKLMSSNFAKVEYVRQQDYISNEIDFHRI